MTATIFVAGTAFPNCLMVAFISIPVGTVFSRMLPGTGLAMSFTAFGMEDVPMMTNPSASNSRSMHSVAR
jgi:hypothetical protein